MRSQRGETSFGQLIAVIGAILIAVGIAWLLAWNWATIPAFLKILILVGLTTGTYVGGVVLREHEYPKVGGAIILLGSALFTLSVFLIAQIFATDASVQGMANLQLISFIGVLIAAYMFASPASLILGLVEVGTWLFNQFIAFEESFDFSPGYLALLYLLMGGLLYGLSLVHRTQDHAFANIYKWWTFAYLLAFSYILSFQTLQPMLWAFGFSLGTGQGILLIILSLGMLATVAAGIIGTTKKNAIDARELLSALGIFIALSIFILLTAILTGTSGQCYEKSCYQFNSAQCTAASDRCLLKDAQCQELSCFGLNKTECATAPTKLSCSWQSDSNLDGVTSDTNGHCYPETPFDLLPRVNPCEKYVNDRTSCTVREECSWSPDNGGYWGYGSNRSLSGTEWFVWIVGNLVLLGMILLTLGHGTRFNNPALVNLGISFFALDIITRYIGFIMDLEGYLSLSLMFISGGVLLLVGGWLLEKWRNSLLEKAGKK
ncbi:DUF2157 domain-containing protein [Candidatus Pacearchaeota archaeon]|nr:DUF2157 domain-containing protein [Candidatus Pacearchaeota archaeon]